VDGTSLLRSGTWLTAS
ncbi:unnamed protein product, partial [Allacma fusca]